MIPEKERMGSQPCAQPLRWPLQGVTSSGSDNRLVCEQETGGFRNSLAWNRNTPLQRLSDVRIVNRGIVEQIRRGNKWRVGLKAAISAAGRCGRGKGEAASGA